MLYLCCFSVCSRQVLPRLLDWEVRKHLSRVQGRQEGLQGAVEMLLGEVFAETERTLSTVRRGQLGAWRWLGGGVVAAALLCIGVRLFHHVPVHLFQRTLAPVS
jgi:hypothetical protein